MSDERRKGQRRVRDDGLNAREKVGKPRGRDPGPDRRSSPEVAEGSTVAGVGGLSAEQATRESLAFVRDAIGRTFTGYVSADERRQCLDILDRLLGRSA